MLCTRLQILAITDYYYYRFNYIKLVLLENSGVTCKFSLGILSLKNIMGVM